MQLLQKDYIGIKTQNNLTTASFICAVIIHNMTKHGQQETSGNSLNHRLKMHFVQNSSLCIEEFQRKKKIHLQSKYLIKYEQTWHLLLKTYIKFIWLKQKIPLSCLKYFESIFKLSIC